MNKYTQTLTFSRRVTIEAKDAADANVQLEALISEVEWAGDCVSDGYYHDFEDEEDEERTEDEDAF